MTDRWKSYWNEHAATVGSEEPLRQVLRVTSRLPISQRAFAAVRRHVVQLLELDHTHVVLDLCCGNGLLCAAVEPHVSRVVGVDFCERLARDVALRTTTKTVTMVADARMLEFPPASFDRVVIAAALQHFELCEAIRMFQWIVAALRPGGLFLVTDVPDASRMWRFHDSVERERAYFDSEAAGTPILGTWFDRAWMIKLGRYAGFGEVSILDQPTELPYAHYRFDVRCRK